MTSRIPMHVIKGGLQGRLERLIRELVPEVSERQLRGNVCQPRNPTRADSQPGSFTIWMRGPNRGAWKDYATGDKGDVIDLVPYCLGCDRAAGVTWAIDWLGLRLVDAGTLARVREDSERLRLTVEEQQRQTDARIVGRARRLWERAQPDIRGTPVMTYLGERGVHPEAIAGFEWGEVRHFPNLECWRDRTHDADGVVTEGRRFPAMVWAIRDAAGALAAVHCTFLRHDGLKKANVGNAKLMLGLVAGGVIRLTRGPSGLSWEDAAAQGIADIGGVGEGVEDGLTLGMIAPEARAFAATSLGNLGNVPIAHPCLSALVVAQDNDWGKSTALDAFETAFERLQGAGKPVSVLRSLWGKDLNDAVRNDDE